MVERQSSATTTTAYTYGNALTRKDGETPLFDGQGSERTVTNAGGAVQATLTLSAFGQAVASSGSSTSAYQYAATSRYRSDGDAGLALVGCRYYDAQVGAFISRDTYLDQKPYAYCDDDPVNGVDPSGHQVVINGHRNRVVAPPDVPVKIKGDDNTVIIVPGPKPPDDGGGDTIVDTIVKSGEEAVGKGIVEGIKDLVKSIFFPGPIM